MKKFEKNKNKYDHEASLRIEDSLGILFYLSSILNLNYFPFV